MYFYYIKKENNKRLVWYKICVQVPFCIPWKSKIIQHFPTIHSRCCWGGRVYGGKETQRDQSKTNVSYMWLILPKLKKTISSLLSCCLVVWLGRWGELSGWAKILRSDKYYNKEKKSKVARVLNIIRSLESLDHITMIIKCCIGIWKTLLRKCVHWLVKSNVSKTWRHRTSISFWHNEGVRKENLHW